MAAPKLTYTSVKVNNKEIGIDGRAKVSFQPSYNSVQITFTPDIQLRRYQIRVTKDGDPYDVDIGTMPVFCTNLQAGVAKTVSFSVSEEYFTEGSGLYRISLYAQSAVDPYEWDVTYLFMVTDGDGFFKFIPADSDGMEVVSDKEIE